MTDIPQGGGGIKGRPALHTMDRPGRTRQQRNKFACYEIYRRLGGSLSPDKFQRVVEQQVSYETIGGILELLNTNNIQVDNLAVLDLEAITKLWVSREVERDVHKIMSEAAFLRGKKDLMEQNRAERPSHSEPVELPGRQAWEGFKADLRHSIKARSDELDQLRRENAELRQRVGSLEAILSNAGKSLRGAARRGRQILSDVVAIPGID
jgi:hypothetical protein